MATRVAPPATTPAPNPDRCRRRNTYGDGDEGCAAGDDAGANPDRRPPARDNGGNTGHSGHLCAPAIPISVHGGAHPRCAAASIADSGAGGY